MCAYVCVCCVCGVGEKCTFRFSYCRKTLLYGVCQNRRLHKHLSSRVQLQVATTAAPCPCGIPSPGRLVQRGGARWSCIRRIWRTARCLLECSDWLKAKIALGRFLPDVEYEWPPTRTGLKTKISRGRIGSPMASTWRATKNTTTRSRQRYVNISVTH